MQGTSLNKLSGMYTLPRKSFYVVPLLSFSQALAIVRLLVPLVAIKKNSWRDKTRLPFLRVPQCRGNASDASFWSYSAPRVQEEVRPIESSCRNFYFSDSHKVFAMKELRRTLPVWWTLPVETSSGSILRGWIFVRKVCKKMGITRVIWRVEKFRKIFHQIRT